MLPVPIEACIRLACELECSAAKPGNVSPGASFADLTHADFMASAPITARWISRAGQLGVGAAIDHAATEIQATIGKNTHLGILLLLAPLSAAAACGSLDRVLQSLTVADADRVYHAIRTLQPGGIGEVDNQDVRTTPTESLLECMKLAADRDMIARQYVNGFREVRESACALKVYDHGVPSEQIVRLHVSLMAAFPDSLIARKCGESVAAESAQRAAAVLSQECAVEPLREFDAWLRADGHRRNPGTTADLVAAALFVALYEHRHPGRFSL